LNKKYNILIINHPISQCGIYQYGVDIYNSLKKSSIYNFIYEECSNSIDLCGIIKKHNPQLIIYNYYVTTMSWLNKSITRSYNIKQIAIMHEVTQKEADDSDTDIFDAYLCPDPTLVVNKTHIFKTTRLIPTYSCLPINIEKITIGSFGFGIFDKGFERLINIVKKEFKEAIVRIHMPFNSVVDIN
jgi:hypothetical protein